MNQMTHLTIVDYIESRGTLQANFSSISDLAVTGNIHLGSHTFKPQQLGDLLHLLLSLHPELNL